MWNPAIIISAQLFSFYVFFFVFAEVNLYRDDDDGDDGGDEHDGVQKLVPAKHLLKSVLDRLQK